MLLTVSFVFAKCTITSSFIFVVPAEPKVQPRDWNVFITDNGNSTCCTDAIHLVCDIQEDESSSVSEWKMPMSLEHG